jgi:hypothetical protein
MKPVSKFSIFITVIALLVIGWVVFTHHDRTTNPIPTPDVGTPTASWPSVEVDHKTISDSNQYYTIDAMYPITKDTGINDQFKAFAEDQVAQFKDDTSWATDPSIDSASKGSLSLDLSYREERSAIADNYIFTIATYTGGAHGLQATRTFSFDQYGAPIALSDLFTNTDAGLKTIAPFVQAELTKKNVADAATIKEGTAPTKENYQNFFISDTGVSFIFDPYQVAPYSEGTQVILVPFPVFKKVANPTLFK